MLGHHGMRQGRELAHRRPAARPPYSAREALPTARGEDVVRLLRPPVLRTSCCTAGASNQLAPFYLFAVRPTHP
jgi:hypothetical protein